MTSKQEPAEIYRQEGARLRDLAGQSDYRSVRDDILDIAHQYDVIAAQADGIRRHTFGLPFGRRLLDRTR